MKIELEDLNLEDITITRTEYNELIEYKALMLALEAAGVDNWEGYDFAYEILEERKEAENDKK